MAAAVIWWVLQLGGLIPASLFLIKFRPAWPIRQPSLIVNGVVFVAWLAYAKSIVVVALQGGVRDFRGVPDMVASLALTALGDVLLALMLAAFLRYRRDWHQNGEPKEESPR